MRKILGSGLPPEEDLEDLLADRRRELEVQAAMLEETVKDLERREGLVRDSRASLERLLRLGTSDLDSRESELVALIRELTAREERLGHDEAELAQRRSELGAVELRRAAVEQREQALAEREAQLAERDRRLGELESATVDDPPPPSRDPSVQLVFVPGAAYRLLEIESMPLPSGAVFALDGVEYVVTRSAPSPLPGDARRCAYLVRGPRGPSSGGSS
jgi:hypothetical protein